MARLGPRELVSVRKTSGIRILTVTSTLTRGGTERVAMNYALGYQRAGYPSAVLAYGGGGPRVAPLQQAGIPVFLGGKDQAARDEAIRQAREWNPDILHLHRPGQTDPISSAVLRGLVHPRLRVFETNIFGYMDPSADRVLIDLHFLLSRWCLWKWTQSVSGLEPRSPGIVVPNAVDCDAFALLDDADRVRIRSAFRIPADAFVYGRVGQPSGGKWSPLLIQAFEAVARQVPQAWLAVCGIPDPLRNMIQRLPDDIRSRVVELPMTLNDAELRGYYGLMDVFVHASEKGESFGLVLCEAMLAGLPVITVSTPLRDNSQIEVVPSGTAGIAVNGLEDTIEAMLSLHADQPLYYSMARHGPPWVREHFDIPVVTGQVLTLAPIALAATSSDDLLRRLTDVPGIVSPAPPDLYRELLREAGVKPTPREELLASWINRPLVRRVIHAIRSMQLRIRALRKPQAKPA